MGNVTFCVVCAGCVNGECTIERVALVVSIVPCRVLDLKGQEWNVKKHI